MEVFVFSKMKPNTNVNVPKDSQDQTVKKVKKSFKKVFFSNQNLFIISSDIDECVVQSTCLNSGVCINKWGSFICNYNPRII